MEMTMRKFPLFFAVCVLAAGCDSGTDHSDVCGDGILGEHEACDGALVREGATAYCPNGAQANMALVKCTDACTLDLTAACATATPNVCGNGVVEEGEQCDGRVVSVKANCESPDYEKLQCINCKIVDLGVCPKAEKPEGTCGNGVVDEGEICDGNHIPAAARQCPNNMSVNLNPLWQCTDSCQVLDVSKACHLTALCGNGKLDTGEACDGDMMADGALESVSCGDGKVLDTSKVRCSQCNLDISQACVQPQAGIMFSEIVSNYKDTEGGLEWNGLAVEFSNPTDSDFDLSSCSVAMITQDGVDKKYAFGDALKPTVLAAGKSFVYCSQEEGDIFAGKCDQIDTAQTWLNEVKTRSDYVLLGVVCGADDTVVDLFNLSSMRAAIVQGSAADFVRVCNASPARTADEAAFANGQWTITTETPDAPAYGLGSHCATPDAVHIAACSYTMSRQELTNRSQSVDFQLDIKIPGITDKTDKTDANPNVKIEFVSGKLKDNGTVTQEIHHQPIVMADANWTDANGTDRYIGTLRNWDTYEGFWSNETGSYVMDAAISFDNGATYQYCGKVGTIQNYETYNASTRNLLTVSYDTTATCGDGVIGATEVCDGESFVSKTNLSCYKASHIILDPNKLACSNCTMIDSTYACGAPIATCGNGKFDENTAEVCDGDDIPESAKVCPDGYIPVDDPQWQCGDTCAYIDTSKACVYACGNSKTDTSAGEICDGSDIPESAKICPKGETPKASPLWSCNDTCTATVTDNACETACGNGKLDAQVFNGKGESTPEICDGTMFGDQPQTCAEDAVYDETRRACTASCQYDPAACVPTRHIVVDEYAMIADESGTPQALAISINLYGQEPTSATLCRISFLDKNGMPLKSQYGSSTRFSTYWFSEIGGSAASEDGKKFMLEPCQPLILCSLPNAKDAYNHYFTDILKNRCTATVSLQTDTSDQIDYLLTKRDEIAHIEITCGGQVIDDFDYAGLVEAFNAGKTHGKIKDTDKRPWPSRTSVKLSDRMDLDDQFDIDKFAMPVCQ